MAPGAGHFDTPLQRALGIESDSTIVLLNPPEGFEEKLGGLPVAAKLRRINQGYRDLTIWFVSSRDELRKRLPAIVRSLRDGDLWVCWPERSSQIDSDLSEDVLRKETLPLGLVDHEVCAIDADWSALRFAKRR